MSGTDESSVVARTGAGMFALWNPARFTAITSYETWEDALLDDQDIAPYIRAGDLAPVNIGSDGAFAFLVRIGPPGLPALTARRAVPGGFLPALPLPVRRRGLPERCRGRPGGPWPGRDDTGRSRRAMRRHRPPDRLGRRTRREGRPRQADISRAPGLRRPHLSVAGRWALPAELRTFDGPGRPE